MVAPLQGFAGALGSALLVAAALGLLVVARSVVAHAVTGLRRFSSRSDQSCADDRPLT